MFALAVQQIIKRFDQESRRPRRAVIHGIANLRGNDFDNGANEGPRGVIFTAVASCIAHIFDFIKILKAGGRAGIVIKNTFLSNTDNASVSMRKLLLESCNLHTVLDLPGGTFTGAGVKTVVLFFEKGVPTEKVWFYQLNLDRNLGKTNALNERDLADFVALQQTQAETENSWSLNVAKLDPATFDLSAKNPNKKEEAALRAPQVILAEMKALDEESADILNALMEMI